MIRMVKQAVGDFIVFKSVLNHLRNLQSVTRTSGVTRGLSRRRGGGGKGGEGPTKQHSSMIYYRS